MWPGEKVIISLGGTITKKSNFPNLWLWLSGLLLLGVIILGIVSYYAWRWLQTIRLRLQEN